MGLLIAAETVLLAQRWTTARVARKRLDQTIREWRVLGATRPSATVENTALIKADLERARESLAAMRAEVDPPGETPARLPRATAAVRRPEAFFSIAAFVEAMRTRAERAGVMLRPDEHFGFSSYLHESPGTDELAAVMGQRQIVQYLLEALWAAQPHQLLAVQRSRTSEKPGATAALRAKGPPAGGRSAAPTPDCFEIDPRISARVPGLVETTAFRLSFTGHTAVLRAMLTRLAEDKLPVFVRAVEVAPAERLAEGPGLRRAVAPVVATSWSRFTVTVELITLGPPPAGAS
jgi:hypothetical protein